MTRFPRFPVVLFVGLPWWLALPIVVLALYFYLAFLILWALVLGIVVAVHSIAAYLHRRRAP